MSTAAGRGSRVERRSQMSGRRRALAPLLRDCLLALAPAALTGAIIYLILKDRWTAYDFHWSYYPAAHRLLDGVSPYAMPSRDIARGTAFVYPALSAIVFAPFALVDRSLADHLYMLACLLMIPTTLWALNVRDWRVYGLPFLWGPIMVGWQGGNVSVPLTCLTALVWKYRDRAAVAGFLTALAISLKPFVWPLALWLLATRRWRAAAYALLSGVLLNLVAWAVVGYNEIPTYVRLSGEVTNALWRGGYSVLAMAHHLGLGRGAGEALMLLAATALIAALVLVGYVKRLDREAMVLAVTLMLIASPLVWNHYFVLLLVPLALFVPFVDALWSVPISMWICPPSMTATGRDVALAWLVGAVCLSAPLIARTRTQVAATRTQVAT